MTRSSGIRSSGWNRHGKRGDPTGPDPPLVLDEQVDADRVTGPPGPQKNRGVLRLAAPLADRGGPEEFRLGQDRSVDVRQDGDRHAVQEKAFNLLVVRERGRG